MTPEQVIDVGREAVWVMIRLGAPSMVVALVVGVVISLLQALTQVQENTLSFLPKFVAMLIVLVVTMPFTFAVLGDFTRALMAHVVDGGAP